MGDYDDGPRGGRPKPKGLALTAMITGILAIPFACLCGLFSAPLALCGIIFGFVGMKQNKGMSITGIACGFVSIVLAIINVIVGIGMRANMKNGQNPFGP